MLIITYTYKTFNEQGFRDTESIKKVNSKNYTEYLDKAKKYNEDCENDIFISEITDTSQLPRHTTCLTYTLPTGLRQVNLRARDLKHNPLGNNPWECIYALPMSA